MQRNLIASNSLRDSNRGIAMRGLNQVIRRREARTASWDGEGPGSASSFGRRFGRPPIMIKYTLPVLDALGFKREDVILSLEMRMKCGIGKRGRSNIGNKYVCTDGPVFTCEELKTLPAEY